MGLFTLCWLHLGCYGCKQTGTWLYICLVGFFLYYLHLKYFPPKTVQKGLFGGFCLFVSLFIFNRNTLYFLILLNFATLSFPQSLLMAQDYFLLDYYVLCILSKTLDSPNKEIKRGKSSWFPTVVNFSLKLLSYKAELCYNSLWSTAEGRRKKWTSFTECP